MLENRINSITIRNYRSLADVTVDLEDLTVLVGPNGSGKSNFLDALRFVRDVLNSDLNMALQARGDFTRLRTKPMERQFVDIEIEMKLTLGRQDAFYSFTVGKPQE